MIRTDIDIKDMLWGLVKNSELSSAISGDLFKDQRPVNSDKEDIIISILARDAGYQIQEAFANINIYVPDVKRGQEMIEDTKRLRVLSSLAASVFEYIHNGDSIVSLSSQEIFKANGIDWHIINNRLRIRFNNE